MLRHAVAQVAGAEDALVVGAADGLVVAVVGASVLWAGAAPLAGSHAPSRISQPTVVGHPVVVREAAVRMLTSNNIHGHENNFCGACERITSTTPCYAALVMRWCVVSSLLLGCSNPAGPTATSASASTTAAPPPLVSSPPAPATPAASSVVLIAGGDVSFGRLRGQRLLREPERDDFITVKPLLDAADIRFVNLECTISDQGGETQSPIGKLVFTAPPPTAPALARANIDIVSLANNHAWDYGESALRETFTRLDAAEVAYVGAGPDRAAAYGPRVLTHRGVKVAFVAVTDIWNQELDPHPGHEIVADANIESLAESVRAAKRAADVVVVSHHGGYEYMDRPHPGTLALFDAAFAAGADAVIGHHPHVVQRVSFVGGKPALYSIGNLLMRMVTGKPWTQFGMFARLTLRRDRPATLAVCPFRIHGFDPIPFAGDPQRETFQALFRAKFDRLLAFGEKERPGTGAVMGDFGADGCAPVVPSR